MSRTDKDRPDWVVAMDPAEDTETIHGRGCSLEGGELDCGLSFLPRNNPREQSANCRTWVNRKHRCYAPKEDRRYGYWKPERAKVRTTNRKFLTSNAFLEDFEEMDDSNLLVSQHRHAPFPHGYWD